MAWRLVRSLDRLRQQVRAAAPRSAPPATAASAWGTIGDTAHTSTSDHSPHTYAALGSTPVVCAADFPHAPALGLDGGVFAEALRRSRDPRIAYVIFNRRIFSSTNSPWTWRAYTGSDPHDTHWHVSVVHTAAADDTRDWAMPGTGDDDMQLSDQNPFGKSPSQFTREDRDSPLWLMDGPNGNVAAMFQYVLENSHFARLFARRAAAESAALRAVVEQLTAVLAKGGGSVDTAAILAGVDERLAKLAAEQRDAVADLGEGGAAQVRGEQ
jgi:hypothetical protein